MQEIIQIDRGKMNTKIIGVRDLQINYITIMLCYHRKFLSRLCDSEFRLHGIIFGEIMMLRERFMYE